LRFNRIVISVEGTNTQLDIPVVLPPERPPLKPGHSLNWNQLQDYIFPIPENPRLHFKLYSTEDDNSPHEEIANIEPHATPGGSYRFWGKAGDLEGGEFWRVHGTEHDNNISQMYAYDVSVAVSRNGGGFTRRKFKPDGTLMDGTENDHHRIWGKRLYAVADGTILDCRNDFPGNPRPLKQGESLAEAFPDIYARIQADGHGAGNFYVITQGGENLVYCHMQEGTLNEQFITDFNDGKTVQVKAGDFLGIAGNSGRSTAPHFHLHSNKAVAGDTSPWRDVSRPMNFTSAWALAWTELTPESREGSWEQLNGRGMPTADCAVWPGNNKPMDFSKFGEMRTIDKLALLIPADIYAKLKSPNPPPVERAWNVLLEMAAKMDRKEKQRTLDHLSMFSEHIDVLKDKLIAGIRMKNR
jgi:hypothetical protein